MPLLVVAELLSFCEKRAVAVARHNHERMTIEVFASEESFRVTINRDFSRFRDLFPLRLICFQCIASGRESALAVPLPDGD